MSSIFFGFFRNVFVGIGNKGGDRGIFIFGKEIIATVVFLGWVFVCVFFANKASADPTAIIYDIDGNDVEYARTIETVTRSIQHYKKPSIDLNNYEGQNWMDVLGQGIEAYTNGDFVEAEHAFNYLVIKGRPRNIDAHVWQVKAFYQRNKRQSNQKKAKDSTCQMLDVKEKLFNIGLFQDFKKRVIQNNHPLEFSADAWFDRKDAENSLENQDYKKASELLRRSVKEDKWNYDSWRLLAFSEYHESGKQTEVAVNVWKEAVIYHPKFKELIDQFQELNDSN